MIELPVIQDTENNPHNKKPDWLKVKLPHGKEYARVRNIIDTHKLHTVCESAMCPNMGECWSSGTATFMILGNICTRSCNFCAVITGRPTELDTDEPYRVAEAVYLMRLKHCVITSVNRDELKDGGASIWAKTIQEVRKRNPNTTIEVLIPDFKGKLEPLYMVLDQKPDILNHNTETVPRLYRRVRPQAKFEWSMRVIHESKKAGLRTKSGIMLGLGETHEEILQVMDSLLENGCDIMTMGQYLQPTKQHLPVERYIPPAEFEYLKQIALEKGFKYVESGPLVRSSYHAERQIF
ncbi:MAG: lipoyl synthase [Bacteroidia bacterium]|nr:lipoyl synthase [Bacteroidia bacterium]MDW8346204.1 lipoyl synthase [Bacteroidia bacterium]